jgi:hypothetical protein
MYMSDGTSLSDFATEEEVDQAVKKILLVYNVEVSDVEDYNVAEICQRIANR